MLPPVIAELKANITDFSAKMGEARAEMAKTEGEGSGHMQALSSVGGAALLAVGASAVVVGAFSLKMADTFESAHARLQSAVTDTGKSLDDFRKPIADVSKQMESFGFTNADTESGLATLTQATHDPAKALNDMSLAADLARARHISLQEAVGILSKVETGHVALLGRMGIATKDAAGHTLTADQAMQALTATFGGAAKTNAETFQGKVAVLKTQLEDLGKNIGMALIPIIESLASTIMDAIQWFEKHKTVAEVVAGVVGVVLVAAIGAYTISMAAAAVATIAATWPIIAIVAVIAGLVAAVIYAYQHWQFFHDAVNAVADYLKNNFVPAAKEVWEWLKTAMAAVWDVAKQVWDGISAAFSAAIAWIQEQSKPFVAFIHAHWDEIKTIATTIWGAISAFLHFTWEVIKADVQLAMAIIRNVIVPFFQFLAPFIKDAFDIIVAVFQVAWAIISGVFKIAVDSIMMIVGVFLDVVTGNWGRAWKDLQQGMQSIWNDIKGIFSGALSAIQGGLSAAWNAITTATSAMTSAVSGVWNGLVSFIQGIPGRIWAFLNGVWNFITSEVSTMVTNVQNYWNGLVGFVQGLPGKVSKALSGIWNFLSSEFKTVANGIIDVWNGLASKLSITVPSWVPDIGGKTFSLPQLQHLATGGIVTQPTVALIGEAGPEAVVPLSHGAMGDTYNITVNASGVISTDLRSFANAVADEMQTAFLQKQRRTGSLGFA